MKIFIVDDEEISLYLTRQVLILIGVTEDIHTFISAKEALDSLSKGNDESLPDIILLDLDMPVMDGWEFLDALAPFESRLKEKCRIYLLTSSHNRSDESRAKENPGIAGLIHKPISSENIGILGSSKKDSSCQQ